MEQCAVFDCLGLFDDFPTPLGDSLFEIFERLEESVDEGLVEELPEMLGRLQFGAVRRLKDEVDAVGNF